jgi:glutathione S-transferase
MDIYADPIATTSRAVLAFVAAEKLPVRVRPIALMKGEHLLADFARLNPNRLVPVLVDGEFTLTESSAILRYLARKCGSQLYPQDLRAQARVDESIAWFESNFYRDFGYGFLYPQLLPQFRLSDEQANRSLIESSRARCERWLQVLEHHILAHRGPYLLGTTATIADLFGVAILSLGEWARIKFDGHPNVQRWYRTMCEFEPWRSANRDFMEFAESLRGVEFVPLTSPPITETA